MNRLRNLATKSFERARELVYYFLCKPLVGTA